MKIAFLAASKPSAQAAVQQFTSRYGQCDIAAADYVVSIGGDGTALKAMHTVMHAARQPVFAMRTPGSVGHLANPLQIDELASRLQAARPITIRPLRAEAEHGTGTTTVHAINEIAITRQRLQAAKLAVAVNERPLPDLVGDGLLIASPIGSTGYNRSAGGSILPHDSDLLALTGVAPHRRCEWTNTVVHNSAMITVLVTDRTYRPVQLETSTQRLTSVNRVQIDCQHDLHLTLLLEYDAAQERAGP
jgi:NAD+ kinase